MVQTSKEVGAKDVGFEVDINFILEAVDKGFPTASFKFLFY
ncbi:hypothetical protein Brsp05_02581 [Brucella sp. NBRC 12953]